MWKVASSSSLLFSLGFIFCLSLFGAPKHLRDGSNLPRKEQEFASLLSIKQRKIFCGQFNRAQRKEAIKFAKKTKEGEVFSPDDAVIKVMEKTGMSLAIKGRPE